MFTGFQTRTTARKMMDVNRLVELLMPVLPEDWEKVSFCAYEKDGGFEMFYYCFTKGRELPIRFSELGKEYRITSEMLVEAFKSIGSMISSFQRTQKKKYSSFTLSFDSSMKFSLQFEYGPADEIDSATFESSWRERNSI